MFHDQKGFKVKQLLVGTRFLVFKQRAKNLKALNLLVFSRVVGRLQPYLSICYKKTPQILFRGLCGVLQLTNQ